MGPKQPVAGPSRVKATSSQAPPPPVAVASFNSARTLFACTQPVLGAADKLTVWDTISDRVIAEWDVEGASKVTTLCWTSVSTTGVAKKRRRRKSAVGTDNEEDVVLLTTDKGGLIVFTPRRGEVLRRLDIGKITASWADDQAAVITTSKEVHILSPDLSTVSHKYSLPENTPTPTAITLLPSSTPEVLHLLVASSSIITLHLNLVSSKIAHTSSPLPVSTSSVTSLRPLPTSLQGMSFLVLCEDDRTVSQYTLSTPTSPAKLSYRYASPTLSPAHSICYTSDLLSILHSSGEVSLFPLPSELDFARPKSDSKPSTLRLVEGKEDRLVRLAGLAFAPDLEGVSGSLVCGKMVGGGRVKWIKAVYEMPEGGVKSETVVKTDAQDLVGSASAENSIPIQRYSAPATTVKAPNETDTKPAATLPTDVDMADLSLGERLLALPNGDVPVSSDKPTAVLDGPVNAASLTRLLVQALHTSDPALLTLCLSHRDPILIRNTIRKMPTQMALPLLKACVERLGQGKNNGKRGGGRGVAQNEQQGRGTVEWVKGVLVERGAILMTMPSLPSHLATLSRLLETRMQLYQPLLSLSGRLDLALAQIAMRRLAAEQATLADGKSGNAIHYVEGESEDESEVDGVRVEVGDGEGEVEDVDMRGMSSESEDEEDEDEEVEDDEDEDEDEDEDSDEDEDEDEDSDDPHDSGSEGGLLDVEAEEGDSGEESEEDDD